MDKTTARTEVAALMRHNGQWSLGTINEDGSPLTTLVLGYAAEGDQPVFLISSLARHTKNLQRNPRASLLITTADWDGDPMASRRVSLLGDAVEVDKTQHRNSFIIQHQYAHGYVDFVDFSFWLLTNCHAEYVSGFGGVFRTKLFD